MEISAVRLFITNFDVNYLPEFRSEAMSHYSNQQIVDAIATAKISYSEIKGNGWITFEFVKPVIIDDYKNEN